MATQNDARSLIDINVYLASLVSNAEAIDPLLDPLRRITAIMQANGQLDNTQVATLQQVKQNLEQYLLANEKARVFTAESLQAQIDYHFSGDNTRRARRNVLVTVMAAAGVSALAGVLAATSLSQEKVVEVIFSIGLAAVHIGAAILFLAALPAFTKQFKRGFRLFCGGIIALSLSFIMQPFWIITGNYDAVIAPIVELVPLVTVAIAAYVGVRFFTQPFYRPATLLNTVGVSIGVATVALICAVVPHAANDTPDLLFRVLTAFHSAVVVLCFAAAAILYAASNKMTDIYRQSTRAIGRAITASGAVALYSLINRIVLGGPPAGPLQLVGLGLVIFMGCLYLYAGYTFNKASRY